MIFVLVRRVSGKRKNAGIKHFSLLNKPYKKTLIKIIQIKSNDQDKFITQSYFF